MSEVRLSCKRKICFDSHPAALAVPAADLVHVAPSKKVIVSKHFTFDPFHINMSEQGYNPLAYEFDSNGNLVPRDLKNFKR